jgi:membrane-anchored mycosin MYCP
MTTKRRIRSWAVVTVSLLLVLVPAGSSIAAPTDAPSSRAAAKKTAAGAEAKPPDSACLTYAKVKAAAESQGNTMPTKEQVASPTWAQNWLSYSDAWSFSRGEGVTVAVVDSGVDASQPQLRGRVVKGYDVAGGKTARGGTTDCAGHGTAVSSLIAAQPVSGIGLVGVAPGATILPIRVTWGVDAKGKETTISFPNFLRALNVAVSQRGVRVINVSVTVPAAGVTSAQRGQLEAVVQKARKNNMLIVAASGNSEDSDSKHVVNYPAAFAEKYDNVIAVTGVLPSYDSESGSVNGYALNETAVTGPWVTVAAPGGNMLCAMARSDKVVACAGTSYAAPYVSGVAALLVSRYPEITPAEVRRLIEMTAETPVAGAASELGFGMVNPLASLTSQLPEANDVRIPGPAAPMPSPSRDRDWARLGAYIAAALALFLAFLLPVGKAVFRRGRARNWKPGQTPT